VERKLLRSEVIGAVAPQAILEREVLQSRGVPGSAIEIIPGHARTEWHAARLLDRWLQQHPDATIAILTERFHSRYFGRVLYSGLGEAERSRVHLRALPDRVYDESNWWQHKEGLLGFFNGGVRLGFAVAFGETTRPRPDWEPDALAEVRP
jgi:hypothetical protein